MSQQQPHLHHPKQSLASAQPLNHKHLLCHWHARIEITPPPAYPQRHAPPAHGGTTANTIIIIRSYHLRSERFTSINDL